MNLFELFVKIGVDDQASGKLKDLGGKLGNGLKTAAKIGTAAVGTAAAGITALTTAAVNNYAEYEQLVGGAELMFGNAYDTVAKNAQDAYKTVQMSQNEYLQQVNGFATGLKTALGGNEQAAAELAHNIIQAEADIIAATGNTAENVQNAFNGIMKSNFTMLDNLQIGITPTKEGFQEVIDKVNEWNKANGEATNYQMGNLADMQSALVDYIDMVGMSGYAQEEASKTISGSVQSMKSAWTNLVTGLADGNADIGQLVDNLVTTVVGDGTDRNLGVLGNIMPAVKRALNGASKLVKELLPVIVNEVPSIIQENLPILANAAVSLVKSLVDGISKNQDMLSKTAIDTIMFLADSILEMLPEIVKLGLNLIVSLAKGIAKNVPKLAKSVIQVIFEIVDILTDKKSLSELLDAAVEIITALAEALLADETLHSLIDAAVNIIVTLVELIGENIDKIFGAAVKIIAALVDYLLDPENAKKIASAGKDIVKALGSALLSAKDGLTNVASDLVGLILEKFLGIDLTEAGKNAIKSLFDGMISALTGSANSSGVGKDIANSLKSQIDGSHQFGLSYVPYDGYIAELHKGERVLTAAEAKSYGSGVSFGDVIINIDGARYTDEQSLADAVAEAIQEMAERRAAVYA